MNYRWTEIPSTNAMIKEQQNTFSITLLGEKEEKEHPYLKSRNPTLLTTVRWRKRRDYSPPPKKKKNKQKINPRWFKVTFLSPSWRSLNHFKGSLSHPKKVTSRIARSFFFHNFEVHQWVLKPPASASSGGIGHLKNGDFLREFLP